MKIYTKGGDRGVASLYNGERCPKGSPVFSALGDVDELNSVLGMAREHVQGLEVIIAEQVRPCTYCFDSVLTCLLHLVRLYPSCEYRGSAFAASFESYKADRKKL